MKINKRKVVFGGCILIILLLMVLYWISVFGDTKEITPSLKETSVPRLEKEPEQFSSRRKAIDQLREKKPSLAPSIYDESLLDSSGTYDPYLKEKEKLKLMDSILATGPEEYDYNIPETIVEKTEKSPELSDSLMPLKILEAFLGKGHAQFFIASPSPKNKSDRPPIKAVVNKDQVVRKDERLELRLLDSFMASGDTLEKNTILYGQCSFKANRLMLTIYPKGKLSQQLEAYDISDGQKGIYIQNSFRSRATTEVLDDVIQDINISGVPQVRGIKGLFQRDNRNVKVKVLHQYQLLLKPAL
ncbi:conjugal transfer protein TraM [Christiangramia fulva]|uniref:Conjugal transfer protein TraM n=1 Tax=Christiangramia fulva TaxID=2126553 RepID=A0A2R3Z1U9_9FLAO|nr:conjugative transposon protein TraM [Christiangramia fulva]AVR44219.1 conjugal transfer protein TraM [Christiangramia fulva]